MTKKLGKEILIGIIATILSVGACYFLLRGLAFLVYYSIADSHVEANVPADKDFGIFLKRDLQSAQVSRFILWAGFSFEQSSRRKSGVPRSGTNGTVTSAEHFATTKFAENGSR